MYGDTAASRKRVAQLREQAGDIRAIADRLVAQAESVPWTGRAAESMRTRIKERASHLRLAAGHHDAAADSLSRHAGEVDALKDAIERISHKAAALTADARTRAAGAGPANGAGADAGSDEDADLLTFVPPPAGHKDWLTVELPGI
jgi:Tfp pilus assembly protein FimV